MRIMLYYVFGWFGWFQKAHVMIVWCVCGNQSLLKREGPASSRKLSKREVGSSVVMSMSAV